MLIALGLAQHQHQLQPKLLTMEASRKTLVPVVSSSTAPKVTMRKAIP